MVDRMTVWIGMGDQDDCVYLISLVFRQTSRREPNAARTYCSAGLSTVAMPMHILGYLFVLPVCLAVVPEVLANSMKISACR